MFPHPSATILCQKKTPGRGEGSAIPAGEWQCLFSLLHSSEALTSFAEATEEPIKSFTDH